MRIFTTILIIIGALMFAFTPRATYPGVLDIPQNMYDEYICLKMAIHFEARGEPTQGMIAVANVVMNRVKSKHYPNSVCGVVTQRWRNTCQFSWFCDEKIKSREPKYSKKVQTIAYKALLEKSLVDVTGGALLFHSGPEPYWASSVRFLRQIGNHRFYR
jgi:spore germination cell wall hydrolase CwlJ-like protein